jgi:beta-glucosidase
VATELDQSSPVDAAQPVGFLWGAATASYQIEGSLQADGAGRCIWEEFSATPGTTYLGQTGAVACDHYNRWSEDIALMRELGLGAYRFSIRWSRVLPEGTGTVNHRGLDFYDQLVDGLLDAGIEPFPTIFHWDLPAALQRRGGWSNRDIANWFGEYTEALVDRLGDRVRRWTTLNEPWVVAHHGHLTGTFAPGIRNIYAACDAIHNQLRAHSQATSVIKQSLPLASVGLALSNGYVEPASTRPEDIAAAETAHAWGNFPLFLEPLVNGRYPAAVQERMRPYMPDGFEDDLPDIQGEPDFVGLNYYFGSLVCSDESDWLGIGSVDEPAEPRTAMDWIIRPRGLHALLARAHRDYHLSSIFVTENGAAFEDHREGSTVDDPDRLAYLQSHTRAALDAREEGVPVDGYFVWSLLDNFEWALGYSKRFGIAYVDYETQERVVKQSGRWYAGLARGEHAPS